MLATWGAGFPFSPKSLFASGAQGAWYDPSDYSTMFEDSAGTTPITSPLEKPVGKMLDKSGRGNHAYQSTTTSRPTLSARYNLLTKTEQFTNSYWYLAVNNGLLDNQAIAPNGTQTAALFVSRNNGQDRVALAVAATLAPSTAHKLSVYVKAASSIDVGKKQSIYAYNGGFLGTNSFTLTSDWQQVSTTFTNPASGNTYVTVAGCETGTNDACSMHIWGADLRVANDGIGLPAYQRVNTATDYDYAGFPPYLKFDGTDDSMATNSIDFTGTDKMFVAAGVRNASTSLGFVATLSNNLTGQGVFGLSVNDSAIGKYISYSKGTLASTAISSAYTPPETAVLNATLDIATNTNILKRNAVQAASTNGNQGGGKFGNYPLYIGTYGSAYLLNGRIYSLVVVGKLASAAEIASTEAYINNRTKAF